MPHTHSQKSERYNEERRQKKIDGEHLDRSPSNGSDSYQDGEIDANTPESFAKETDAATTFGTDDELNGKRGVLRSDGSRVSYNELFEHHVGRHPQSSGDEYRELERDDRRTSLIETLGSQLELNQYQQKRAVHMCREVDFGRAGRVTEEQIALACVGMTVNLDDRHLQREEIYKEIRSDLGLEASDVKSARQILRDQLDL